MRGDPYVTQRTPLTVLEFLQRENSNSGWITPIQNNLNALQKLVLKNIENHNNSVWYKYDYIGQEFAIVISKTFNKIYIYKGERRVKNVKLDDCPQPLRDLLSEQINLITANKKPVLFFDDEIGNFKGKEYNLDNLVDCVQISNDEIYNFPFDAQNAQNIPENLPYFFKYNMVFPDKMYLDPDISLYDYYYDYHTNTINRHVWAMIKKYIIYINTNKNKIYNWLRQYNLSTLNKEIPTDPDAFNNNIEQHHSIFQNYFLYVQLYKDSTFEVNNSTKDHQTNATMGLSKNQMTEIEIWSENPESKTIVFDWDKTLTVLPGFASSKFNNENYIEFIFGGPTRFQRIKDLFKNLHKKEKSIYILTSNGQADTNRENFFTIIRTLDPLFNKENLIYSGNYEKNPYKSRKIVFLQQLLLQNQINNLQKIKYGMNNDVSTTALLGNPDDLSPNNFPEYSNNDNDGYMVVNDDNDVNDDYSTTALGNPDDLGPKNFPEYRNNDNMVVNDVNDDNDVNMYDEDVNDDNNDKDSDSMAVLPGKYDSKFHYQYDDATKIV